MAIVTLRLPTVKSQVDQRPTHCPHCHCTFLQGWGQVTKPLRDPPLRQVVVRRFRCCDFYLGCTASAIAAQIRPLWMFLCAFRSNVDFMAPIVV